MIYTDFRVHLIYSNNSKEKTLGPPIMRMKEHWTTQSRSSQTPNSGPASTQANHCQLHAHVLRGSLVN